MAYRTRNGGHWAFASSSVSDHWPEFKTLGFAIISPRASKTCKVAFDQRSQYSFEA